MSLLYGKLHTSYLVSLFKKSNAHKGKTISNFFAALETRLDTTLYRVQFAPTLQAARQLISHQKICVNNVILTKPGYILQPGDVISIAPNAIAHVGQSIQQFLRADNTQTSLNTVGLLKKFRARKRRRKPSFKRLRFRLSFRSKRVVTQARITRYMSNMEKNAHTYKNLAWKEATVSKKNASQNACENAFAHDERKTSETFQTCFEKQCRQTSCSQTTQNAYNETSFSTYSQKYAGENMGSKRA